MSENKIQVEIAGMSYTLITDESENFIKQIAAYVDKKIREVDNDKLTKEMQLVLASINVANDLFKLAVRYDSLDKESREPLEKYPLIKEEFETVKAENAKIKEDYEKSNQEFIKSVEKIEDMNTKINLLNSEIDKQKKLNTSKDQDLKKARENIKSLQEKLAQAEKEIQVLKRDL